MQPQLELNRSWQPGLRSSRRQRKGSVMVLFTFLLPVLLIFCALAINVAYMQLTCTEIKIATDASARAGGRAMSVYQNTDKAMQCAQSTAALNMVAGKPLVVPLNETYITFGTSKRANNGYGRYEFTAVSKAKVDSRQAYATSVKVLGEMNTPALFRYTPTFKSFTPSVTSVATQLDRDCALILDRSGSMGDYNDFDAFDTELARLKKAKLISSKEYDNAVNSDVYGRSYSKNVQKQLTGEMQGYAQTYDTWIGGGVAPIGSRWDRLKYGVSTFLDVLTGTDQQELVSVASFANDSRLDLKLESDYAKVLSVTAAIRPYNATAIGLGMNSGLDSLLDATKARPFAAKTIVVLTDGINNVSPDPVTVARDIVAKYNVTIHTVTFSSGADQTAMQQVADIGHGKHYHANTGAELTEIFREIANNLPTILTE